MSEQADRSTASDASGDVSARKASTSEYERHGGFPKLRPARPGPDFTQFVEAMRTLQDLAVCADAPEEVYGEALAHAREMIELLDRYRAAEGRSPAGRAFGLPGRGSLLMPPWRIEHADPTGVRGRGTFRRYHVGGNAAVHGGVIPLLFDDLFGHTCHFAGRAISRTGYLTVNYRKITPFDVELVAETKVGRIENRKTFLTAELRDLDGALLADAEALMIKLHPWQP